MPGGEGAGGACDCVGEIRREGSAAAAAAEAGGLCGCETSAEMGRGPGWRLSRWCSGSGLDPGDYGFPAGQGTAPGCCWWGHQRGSTGWPQAYS